MPTLKLRAVKAKHGDALLLTTAETKVLIDGGPSGVYNTFLRDELSEIPSNNSNEVPIIDLLIVSHIDSDHIDGVLDLTSEMLEAREEERDPPVQINEAWHNSFSDLILADAEQLSVPQETIISSATILSSQLGLVANETFSPDLSRLVLTSVRQGRNLRLDFETLNIDLNHTFPDRFVLRQTEDVVWKSNDLEIRVVGPTRAEVDKLRKEWKKQLPKILGGTGTASTESAIKLDESVSNLASIVAIAAIGDKRVLLTGDARGDMILEWLEISGWLAPGDNIHFDILKLPHHGSNRNVTPEFFKRITADHYLVSGNGGHGNPEPKMFDMLFNTRPNLDYTIHMTYGPDELKRNSQFISVGNVKEFETVFSDTGRLGVLKYPDDGESHIDIDI